MDPTLSLALGLVAGLAIGAAVTALVLRSRARTADAVAAAQRETALARERATGAEAAAEREAEIAALAATAEGLREQLALAAAQHREFVGKVEQERAERAAAQAQEGLILKELAPVQENLRSMQRKVAELEEQRQLQHGELKQQLLDTRSAGEEIRASAAQLREALKSNSSRGMWGEVQLRAVVEAAGMLDRVNFDVQSTLTAGEARLRPDMIVRLPGGKTIAVDSKVPFNAYLEASAIPATASGAEAAHRDALLKQHVKAVRDHVVALSDKRYWSALETSPEMVVAFIPSESLLSAALEADPSIMEFAFGRHVALASPVTLFSVLKAIAVSWSHDEVTKEAKALFDVSRDLYGRLVTLAQHVDKLGRSLERSVKDYNAFVGSLERQVLPSARRLSKLDESKVLPAAAELDVDVREVSGSDLTPQLVELDRLGEE